MIQRVTLSLEATLLLILLIWTLNVQEDNRTDEGIWLDDFLTLPSSDFVSWHHMDQ